MQNLRLVLKLAVDEVIAIIKGWFLILSVCMYVTVCVDRMERCLSGMHLLLTRFVCMNISFRISRMNE